MGTTLQIIGLAIDLVCAALLALYPPVMRWGSEAKWWKIQRPRGDNILLGLGLAVGFALQIAGVAIQ